MHHVSEASGVFSPTRPFAKKSCKKPHPTTAVTCQAPDLWIEVRSAEGLQQVAARRHVPEGKGPVQLWESLHLPPVRGVQLHHRIHHPRGQDRA